MNYIKVTFCILFALSVSRCIPHPPNFTSLLALSFYIPAFFGRKYIPAVIISLSITDLFIGFHSTILFTWGSVLLIGLLTKYYNKSLLIRIFGALSGAVLFFIITNFGVWSIGSYEYTTEGLLKCYILALPFFGHSLISTMLFSVLIETIYKFYNYKKNYFNSLK
mgnify:CR=1 FL=1|tara:strand:- start:1218 stop:1712 length:495 start_codon:yes stop_codon:yes gene_type:complete